MLVTVNRYPHKGQQGFNLVELLVVIAILLIIALGSVKLFQSLRYATIDSTTQLIVSELARVRAQAIAGDNANFQLQQVQNLIKNANGITVSTMLPAVVKGSCNSASCATAICTTQQTICYSVDSSFSFAPYSGRKTTTNAIFIANDRRAVAIIAETSGQIRLLDFASGRWEFRK
jgi:prepilin-type N-terminal cleavage/methylation domain-containing protein